MNNLNWISEIKKRTSGIPVRSGKSDKFNKISFDDLIFVPAQLNKKPVDYFKEEINSSVVFGKKSKKSFKIAMPIIIGGMSFGALSKEAKVALAKASSLAGIVANTGEGGMLKEERVAADKLIVQYSTGRFGIDEEVLKSADAIEIKIGQGAKPGSGGLLSQDKITDEIAEIRKISRKEDVHSPAYHKDIQNIDDLKEKVNWLKRVSGDAPVIIKIGAGEIEKDIEFAVKANPDIIAIDGLEGGTGASHEVMLNEVGIPAMPALVRARKKLDDLKSDCELWIGGSFSKGGDIAKALALGANGVFMAFPFLIAMGCVYCRQCHLGRCPMGVATQDPKLREAFDMDNAVENIVKFVKTCNEEIKMISGSVGKQNIYDLKSTDLRSLTSEMAKVVKVKTCWEE